MDELTVRIYEDGAAEWGARRADRPRVDASDFRSRVDVGAVRVDAGCGPGRSTAELGTPVLALDAAFAMVALARDAAPGALGVRADLEALPVRFQGLGGAWAQCSYLHVPKPRLPAALAELHHATRPGAPLVLGMKRGAFEGHALPGDDFPGRFFALWEPEPLAAVVEGAGFDVDGIEASDAWIQVHATRARTLPDFVGPDLRLLVCGLNPSLRSADVGIGYAGRSNRFWAAAIEAGLTTRARDPWHLLRHHSIGMTDLVKRATVGAGELRSTEYRNGAARVERLVRWLEPGAVCFVGLAGWRVAVDRHAQPGVQPEPFGGAPAYVMPSTSGLNARTPRAELAAHLGAALELGTQGNA
jgi:TDG/mug DNA glycosylase family protein